MDDFQGNEVSDNKIQELLRLRSQILRSLISIRRYECDCVFTKTKFKSIKELYLQLCKIWCANDPSKSVFYFNSPKQIQLSINIALNARNILINQLYNSCENWDSHETGFLDVAIYSERFKELIE